MSGEATAAPARPEKPPPFAGSPNYDTNQIAQMRRDFWGKPGEERSFFFRQEPTAQRRAINSESFRESLLTERY